MAHRFGELWPIILTFNFVGEIFCRILCAGNFSLAKKFGEINPLSLEWVTQFIRPVTNEGVDKHNQILFFNQKFEVKKVDFWELLSQINHFQWLEVRLQKSSLFL